MLTKYILHEGSQGMCYKSEAVNMLDRSPMQALDYRTVESDVIAIDVLNSALL